MTLLIQCDRCGTRHHEFSDFVKLVATPEASHPQRQYDLCVDCYAQWMNWLEASPDIKLKPTERTLFRSARARDFNE